MSYDYKHYLHKDDKAALNALRAIPGFQPLIRAQMKLLSERQFRISTMSSCVRTGETQLSKYYNMLPPICEALGIDLPELYLQLDVRPNAYTYGDSHPFIVITSGLLETLPEELIPTVIAHECGHIACHHVLYRTMGHLLLQTSASALKSFVPYGKLVSLPLEVAFYYWMRCSEFSADRAAMLYDGTSEKMQDVCMCLAGFDKDVNADADKEAFLQQAREYREMVGSSMWDKTLEFMMFRNADHPLMAVRTLECEEWGRSDQFQSILDGTYNPEPATEDEQSDTPEPEESVEGSADDNNTPKEKERFAFPKFASPFGKKKPALEQESQPAPAPDTLSVPDEIRQYKALLDDGILTEEEFIAKKKQLLNL